ncbi:OLC1v1013501C1 [Oldenlandia corymbosa var. corymbosa]|uniref:OLC1v1013501C1 n=1 Tax=Oldenlandia corymbosa var. corymbosa TaxID=529605 RepID=A0AAV1DYP2_OLDCO|nr:OLC1v1013501C1 [Oldenlandia corymbosa var. corymbosa]
MRLMKVATFLLVLLALYGTLVVNGDPNTDNREEDCSPGEYSDTDPYGTAVSQAFNEVTTVTPNTQNYDHSTRVTAGYGGITVFAHGVCCRKFWGISNYG